MHLDSAIITAAFNAHKCRDIAITNAKGAHLHAKIDKFLSLKLKGEQVKITCRIHNDYKKHVAMERRESVLCITLNSGSHGTLQGALLWCKLLALKLTENRFETNPHDLSMANKHEEGSECAMAFHADNTKISYKNPVVVAGIAEMLEAEFEPVVFARGKRHNFLRTNVEFANDSFAKIQMKSYSEKAEEACGKKIKKVNAPDWNNLFNVNAKSDILLTLEAEIFCSVAHVLSCAAAKARRDS